MGRDPTLIVVELDVDRGVVVELEASDEEILTSGERPDCDFESILTVPPGRW